MPFEMENDDDDRLIIDMDKKAVKGYCKGHKGFKKQIDKIKEFTGL